jgi:hypothetical protein
MKIVGGIGSCDGVGLGTFNVYAVQAKSGIDIIQTCGQTTTVCTNCLTRTAGSYTPGIEKYTFEGKVDLRNLPSSCCKVRIGFTECCRNNAITTGGAGDNYYVEAIIDRCLSACSNAPIFTTSPVAIACNGQDFTYNLGAVDPDGDSLSFNLAPSLNAPASPISYTSPYSPNVPFPFLGAPNPHLPSPAGLHLDPVTGDLRVRPMGNFVSVLVIEVKQWRKIGGVMTHIGTTRRDLQFYSVPCPSNTPPYLNTFDAGGNPSTPSTRYDYSICAGQSLCFMVEAKDDTTDTTDFVIDTLMLTEHPAFKDGATFQPVYSGGRNAGPRQDKYMFCWTPTIGMGSEQPYYISFTARDRACPVPGRFTKAFSILVRPVPDASINSTVIGTTLNLTYTLKKPTSISPGYTQWGIETAPGTDSFNVVQGDTVNYIPPVQGIYKVRLRLQTISPPSGGCTNDSIMDSVNYTIIGTGISDAIGLKGLQVFPNPARESITLMAAAGNTSVHAIDIYGIDGRFIAHHDLKYTSDRLRYDIPLQEYARGLYIIKLHSAEGDATLRFIKE